MKRDGISEVGKALPTKMAFFQRLGVVILLGFPLFLGGILLDQPLRNVVYDVVLQAAFLRRSDGQ